MFVGAGGSRAGTDALPTDVVGIQKQLQAAASMCTLNKTFKLRREILLQALLEAHVRRGERNRAMMHALFLAGDVNQGAMSGKQGTQRWCDTSHMCALLQMASSPMTSSLRW